MIHEGCSLRLSAIQIYNNKIFDLSSPNLTKQLQTYECNHELIFKTSPQTTQARHLSVVRNWICKIKKNQIMGTTSINSNSSRSHTIFFIEYEHETRGVYRFTAIDLAGNERTQYSTAQNKIQKRESIHINKSLFALKECIRASKLNKKHIPYRRSILTMFIKDALIQKSRLIFLTTLHTSQFCYHDIINSIEYTIYLIQSNIQKNIEALRPDIQQASSNQNNNIIKQQIPTPPSKDTNRTIRSASSQSRPKHLNHRRLKSAPNSSKKNQQYPVCLTTDYRYNTLTKIYKNYILNLYEILRKDQQLYHSAIKSKKVLSSLILSRIKLKQDMLMKFKEKLEAL